MVLNYEGSRCAADISAVRNCIQSAVWTMPCDYNSKDFQKVTESKSHRDSVNTEKLKCVGHVEKKSGIGLTKLREDIKSKKLSAGEVTKECGRLTDAGIDKLQLYTAIRTNGANQQEIKWAVWPTFFLHKPSPDDISKWATHAATTIKDRQVAESTEEFISSCYF
jgi:hypothetical protein